MSWALRSLNIEKQWTRPGTAATTFARVLQSVASPVGASLGTVSWT